MLFFIAKIAEWKRLGLRLFYISMTRNMPYLIFYLTVQEEFLLILLQFLNPNFDNAFNIASFILAIFASIHMIIMIFIIIK